MQKNSWWWWVGLGLILGCGAYGLYRLPGDEDIQTARLLKPPHRPAPKPVFNPEPPIEPSEPSSEIPTLVEVSEEKIEARVKALAHEMADMWTRNPEELVVVIDDAARSMPSAPSVTM